MSVGKLCELVVLWIFQQNMSLLEDESQTMEDVEMEENNQILIEGTRLIITTLIP